MTFNQNTCDWDELFDIMIHKLAPVCIFYVYICKVQSRVRKGQCDQIWYIFLPDSVGCA